MNKLTKSQRDNIRFAIRWMDGDKLYNIKHIKGDEWQKLIEQGKDEFHSALTGLPPYQNAKGGHSNE